MLTKKQTNKPSKLDLKFFMQKNYVILFDYVQFKIVQFIFFVLIVPSIIDVKNGGMAPAELFYDGRGLWSILLLGLYLFIIDFYFPKFSIAKKVFSYKMAYPENLKLKEQIVYILLKLCDTFIAPFKIIFSFFFSKISTQLYSEKHTRIYLYKY